jgi:hypothetical protein
LHVDLLVFLPRCPDKWLQLGKKRSWF